MKTISILGCGWFGLPFAKALVADGFTVNGSTTTSDKLAILKEANINPFLIDANENIYHDDFFKCDLLFINIPPKKKVDDVDLYPNQLKVIAEKAIANQVKHIVFVGSTGIYEDGNFTVDEDVIPNPNTLAGNKLKLAEAVFMDNNNFTTTIIRFAGLIGPNRNLAKFFAGRTAIPNGLAPVNLIHLTDCIGVCKAIIQQKQFGKIYHAVAPSHPTRQDFYTQLCQSSAMPLPAFLNEKHEWKQVESKNVPELNYRYVYDNLMEYLEVD
jgi:nucleoside-diphosphate-sugar epimerase